MKNCAELLMINHSLNRIDVHILFLISYLIIVKKSEVKHRENLSKINGFNAKTQAGSFGEIVDFTVILKEDALFFPIIKPK